MDPTIFEPLRQLLECTTITTNTNRKNSGGDGRSQPFGVINRRQRGIGYGSQNVRYPEIYKELKRLHKIICPESNYTAFMLNVNYTAKTHVDKNNDGESTTFSFGDFTGGELKIEDTLINTRYCPFTFNAVTTPHSVEQILSGKRYSVVMFRPRYTPKFREKYPRTITLEELETMLEAEAILQNKKITEIKL